jgi:hypothetical protein
LASEPAWVRAASAATACVASRVSVGVRSSRRLGAVGVLPRPCGGGARYGAYAGVRVRRCDDGGDGPLRIALRTPRSQQRVGRAGEARKASHAPEVSTETSDPRERAVGDDAAGRNPHPGAVREVGITILSGAPAHYLGLIARSRSVMRSSLSSMPTERRRRPSATPLASRCSRGMAAWVMVAGCVIRDSTPPRDSAK